MSDISNTPLAKPCTNAGEVLYLVSTLYIIVGMAKRPRSEIQSVLVHVKGDIGDAWVPKKIEKNSWISLNPPRQGPWAKQDFVAQVKKFKFAPNSTTLQSILVTHAYYHRQLKLEKTAQHGVPSNRVNCEFT